MSKYILMSPSAQPGVALKIFERSEEGLLIGEYKGYYDYKREVFTLYPAYNPFASKNGQLKKHTISARLVRYP